MALFLFLALHAAVIRSRVSASRDNAFDNGNNMAGDEGVEIPQVAHASPWSLTDILLGAWPWHYGAVDGPGERGREVSAAAFIQQNESQQNSRGSFTQQDENQEIASGPGKKWGPWKKRTTTTSTTTTTTTSTTTTTTTTTTSCFANYSVKFKLGTMHSWFEVPTCSSNHRTWSGGELQHSLDRLRWSLEECGKCKFKRFTGAAAVHWNIRHCTQELCVWPTGGAMGVGNLIGPEDGLPVHPQCAWGMVRELAEVYRTPYREAGMDGVRRALGVDALNPINLAKAGLAGLAGGMGGISTAAAQAVNWHHHLSPNCNGARTKEKILERPVEYTDKKGRNVRNPIGAVCWNNVMDFRDLWCHYKDQFDVTSEAVCKRKFRDV